MRPLIYSSCVCLALVSCTVFSPYHNTRDYWYHRSLSKQDKSQISPSKPLVKEWLGTNKKGDYMKGPLLVQQNSKGRYAFTEIGTWQHQYQGMAGKGWRATVTDSIVHDSRGNIRYRVEYLDENQDSVGRYLFEQWSSNQTDSLRQTVISYYGNGKIRYRQQITVLNPEDVAKDYDKKKVLTDTKAYNEAGQPISGQEVEKLVYSWFQPYVSMKK